MISSDQDYQIIMAEEGLKKDEIEDCMKWAFGTNFNSQRIADGDATWNARHKHIFEVKGSDAVSKTLQKIARVYKRLFL